MSSSKVDVPDPQTFGSTLGQAVWLMTMTKTHRDLPVHEIEKRVALPIFLRQFRLYSKAKQPVAFLTWASVSDVVKARLESGDTSMAETDWRSGPHMVVVDVVSPYNTRAEFEAQFFKALKD